MAKVYAAPLQDIAYAARAGAAGQAQRENAKVALDVAQQQQANQFHVDALAQQMNERQMSRDYDLANQREGRVAQQQLTQDRALAAQQLTQQKADEARRSDAINQQQAIELQDARLNNAGGMNRAEALDGDVSSVQKYLAGTQFTPQGKAMSTKLLNKLNIIRGKNGFLKPHEYAGFLSQWLGDVNTAGLDAYKVEEPGPDQDYGVKVMKRADGEEYQLRADSKGNKYFEPIKTGSAKKGDEEFLPADKYFADPGVYDREEKAAYDRITQKRMEDLFRDGGAKNDKGEPLSKEELLAKIAPPSEDDLYQEMVRRKAARDRRVLDLRNGIRSTEEGEAAPPAGPPPPVVAPPVSAPPPAGGPAPTVVDAPTPVPAEGTPAGVDAALRTPAVAEPSRGSEVLPGATRKRTLSELVKSDFPEAPTVMPEPEDDTERQDEQLYQGLFDTAGKFGVAIDGLEKDMGGLRNAIGKYGWNTSDWPPGEENKYVDAINTASNLQKFQRDPTAASPLPNKWEPKTLERGLVYGPIKDGKTGRLFHGIWTGKGFLEVASYETAPNSDSAKIGE